MLIGDPGFWLTCFRDVEQRLIHRLPMIWPTCTRGLPRQPHENEITRRLVFHLRKDPHARSLGAIHWQLALLKEQLIGDVVPKGYIDMAIVLGEDPECYVAFECKRLNVLSKNKMASLATPYVEEGMMRYVRAQYARELPLGAMIGYVLDGNVASAARRICRAISRKATKLHVNSTPPSAVAVGFFLRLNTIHNRPGDIAAFELRHTLLPFPSPSPSSTAGMQQSR
jgi:hypothetical protein